MCDDDQYLVALETVSLGISVYLQNILGGFEKQVWPG